MSDKQKKLSRHETNNPLLSRLIKNTEYLDRHGREKIVQAYEYATLYHGPKKRLNGQYLVSHGTEVCMLLAKLKLDKDCLIAAILHDINLSEDAETKRYVFKHFGYEVVFLMEQVRLLVHRLSLANYKGNEFSAEYLRQMFVATTQDLRAVILKLADRTHDLRSLESFSRTKIKQIATESLYIDAHIAARLGIYYFKNELENLSFRHTHPEIYAFMENHEAFNIQSRDKTAESLTVQVENFLKIQNLDFLEVKGRAKTYYSIFSKLKKKRGDINKIYDLIALRIVVRSIPECYKILQSLHKYFEPLKDRYKDFIRSPKIDGYQSLHTTVKHPKTGLIFEFQIRTKRMDEFAEYGPVAHWRYKHQAEVELVDFLDPQILKEINEELSKAGDTQQLNATNQPNFLKKRLSLFEDKIFALNEEGEVYRLSKGSTAADYIGTYYPHLKSRVFFVKINNKVCPLSQQINTGDVVEIIDSAYSEPSRVRLSLKKS